MAYNLKNYLRDSGTTQSKMARVLGISRPYMSQLVGGTRRPGREVAIAIETATNGAVPVKSWAAETARNASALREVS
ncbi:hypothetical protein BMI86_10165 [Thioclava sp. DLFJ5-1]|nr:hypothetical protein BMI86_10165 [Thioclava sp. DLFJ5-1]